MDSIAEGLCAYPSVIFSEVFIIDYSVYSLIVLQLYSFALRLPGVFIERGEYGMSEVVRECLDTGAPFPIGAFDLRSKHSEAAAARARSLSREREEEQTLANNEAVGKGDTGKEVSQGHMERGMTFRRAVLFVLSPLLVLFVAFSHTS